MQMPGFWTVIAVVCVALLVYYMPVVLRRYCCRSPESAAEAGKLLMRWKAPLRG